MAKKQLDTTFENWIKSIGFTRISRLLEVNEEAVKHWLAGRALPKARHMKRIKEITKGKVSYTEIIEGSCSQLNR
jgi:DNA-binding transcriptional regulator YdaS (Cro superfamily)